MLNSEKDHNIKLHELNRIVKFILPDAIIIIIILCLAGTLNNFWHKFDDYSKSLTFLSKERFRYIIQCYNGLEHTGQPFLREYEYTDSLGIKKVGYCQVEAFGDDVGMYYFIPIIIKLLKTNPVHVFDLFYLMIVLTGFVLGITGIKLLYNNRTLRIISYIYLSFFTFFCFYIFDVHVWTYLLVSIIPLFIWVIKKSARDKKISYLYTSTILIGILIGIGNQFRSQSGTGLFLFILTYLIFMKKDLLKINHKVILIILLFVSTLLCGTYFNYVLEKRDAWLKENNQGVAGTLDIKHPFWHPMYLGLAYIKDNKYGIVGEDWYAFRKAYSIDSSLDFKFNYWAVISSRYEEIMKNLYLDILKNDPLFVIKTYFLKSIEILLYILIFFNIGLILLFLVKPGYKKYTPFLIGVAFYSIPGVLFLPFLRYILGALSMGVYCLLLLTGEYLKKHKA